MHGIADVLLLLLSWPCCAAVYPAVLVEVVAALQAAGIGVPQFHAEAAPGQFEVVLSPCE